MTCDFLQTEHLSKIAVAGILLNPRILKKAHQLTQQVSIAVHLGGRSPAIHSLSLVTHTQNKHAKNPHPPHPTTERQLFLM